MATGALKNLLSAFDFVGYRPIPNLPERLNYLSSIERRIWFHAASVGEVRGVFPLLKLVKDKFGANSIIFTTTSNTGRDELTRLMPDVECQLAPFDSPWPVNIFLNAYKPRVLILNETEIWPCMLSEVKKYRVKTILVNGRISDKAFPKYKTWKFFFKEYFLKIDKIFSQTRNDTERFRVLDVLPSAIETMGSTKYDFPQRNESFSFKTWWRNLEQDLIFKKPRKIVVLGSIREEEEKDIVKFLGVIESIGSDEDHELLVIIGPRHPQRFNKFCSFLKEQGFSFLRRSQSEKGDPLTRIIVLDVMGELLDAYRLADICFVGGTFSKVGGHNILEPAYFSKPLLTGFNTQNMKEISDRLISSGGMAQVADGKELGEVVLDLIPRVELLGKMGVASGQVYKDLRGSSLKIFHWMENNGIFNFDN